MGRKENTPAPEACQPSSPRLRVRVHPSPTCASMVYRHSDPLCALEALLQGARLLPDGLCPVAFSGAVRPRYPHAPLLWPLQGYDRPPALAMHLTLSYWPSSGAATPSSSQHAALGPTPGSLICRPVLLFRTQCQSFHKLTWLNLRQLPTGQQLIRPTTGC